MSGLSKRPSEMSPMRMSSEAGSATITASAPAVKGGESSVASSVFNLAKAIVGCGVLFCLVALRFSVTLLLLCCSSAVCASWV